MSDAEFCDEAPTLDIVTAYDERHLVTYLRLLDADAENADWEEAVRLIFNLDPRQQPDRARAVHASHLERARWMSRTGYRQLAARAGETPKTD
jgi:hypothetical protein